MANFIVAVDPDVRRRSAFLEEARPRLPLVDGLTASESACGDCVSAWACEPRAPVSRFDGDAGMAVIWGEAIPGPGPERLTARRLVDLWGGPSVDAPPIFDGFHAAFAYAAEGRVTVAADPLGIFPVYYWHTDEVLLAASSPELFRYHPLFTPRFNPASLVGLLLTGRLFDGRQLLWRDVRRLGPGHALLYRRGAGGREVRQYAVPLSQRYLDLPLSGQVSILEAAFGAAVARHAPPDRPMSLSLSGGLDSRMLAGFLQERGARGTAVTFGDRTDLDTQCAIPVARALGLEHRIFPVMFSRYPAAAERDVTWGHLVSGFESVLTSVQYPELRQCPAPLVAGHLMTHVLGGVHIDWAYSFRDGSMSFQNFFQRLGYHGLGAAVLDKVLRPDVFGTLVRDTTEQIRSVYESYSELESQRAWCFEVYHGQRFFIGGTAWKLALGAWPVYPGADREVLQAAAGMPAAALAERRAQVELVCRRFPHLAALPLDRTITYETTPLLPRARWWIGHVLRDHLMPRPFAGRRRVERLFYKRTYDFNGPGWRAIRRLAEDARANVFPIFDEAALNALVPPPEATVPPETPTAGIKCLLGFFLWAKGRL